MKIEHFLLLIRCDVLDLGTMFPFIRKIFLVYKNNISDLIKQTIGSYDLYYNICENKIVHHMNTK
jgi:hypothetical protein